MDSLAAEVAAGGGGGGGGGGSKPKKTSEARGKKTDIVDRYKEINDKLNDVKDSFTDEYSFNIESVPAERAAVILCGKDSTLYNVNDFEKK